MMKRVTKMLGQMVLAIAAGIALGCILVYILNNL
nr:MAG TPA: hypothetical protein [Caudoviricetes sp.]